MPILCQGCDVDCETTGYGLFIGPYRRMLALCESCYVSLRKEINDLEDGTMYADFLKSFNREGRD